MTDSRFCFHCSLPVKGEIFYLTVVDVKQAFCCIGCQSVAKAIIDNGLGSYYEFRDQASPSQINAVHPELLELEQYNMADIQDQYLQSNQNQDSNWKKIILSIDGITCAACIWLLEKRITVIDGVTKFSVNMTNHRAELCWDDSRQSLAQILLAIAKIGYRAQPFEADKEDARRKIEYRQALKRLAVSGFGFGQVMMFAAPLYSWFSHGIPDHYRDFFRVVSLVVTTPVLLYCGLPFFQSAWISLKSRLLSMDVSISLALLVVYIAGIYATIMQTGEVYFDSITMFLFFITLSRYLEMRARHHSSFVVQQHTHQQPTWVTRMRDGVHETIAVSRIEVSDVIIVKTGTTIPVDGVLMDDEGSVSESLLTGESLPKAKHAGNAVAAGSLNVGNPLTMRVTRVGGDTTLATILKLFERAQFDKPQIVSLTQRFSHYFVILQILTAIVLFAYWLPFSASHAFWVTISLLVISCPCALAIATPIALTATMNAMSRIGFFCTRGHVIEALNKTTDIIFDKTGTLTEGKFSIHSVDLMATMTELEVLKIAASLEVHSEHPIASAFKSSDDTFACEQVVVHANKGIEAYIAGDKYYLGNAVFICESAAFDDNKIKSDSSMTSVYLANHSTLLAVFHLEDKLRHGAYSAIQSLASQYRIHLLSGDHLAAVKHYAEMLGITNYHANCSPSDKLNYVKSLQNKGAEVVMLGDGINDAPVLMQAQVSIAMGEAADLTRISADAVLMKNDLSVLEYVFKHADKTNRIIRQCLVWAVVYNIVCLPLAVSGIVAPYVAAVLMSMSSILVVANALRLVKINMRASANHAYLQLAVAGEG